MKMKSAILMIATVLGISVNSMATTTVDQQNTASAVAQGVIASNYTWGQSITSSVPGTLDSVEVFFHNLGGTHDPENIVAKVKLNGSYVGTDTEFYPNVGDSSLLFDFKSDNISLASGDKWILELTGSDTIWNYALNVTGNNAYAGGTLIGMNGVDYSQMGYDMQFIENVNVAANVPANNPVPEPSTFILLGAGLAGAAFWRRKKA